MAYSASRLGLCMSACTPHSEGRGGETGLRGDDPCCSDSLTRDPDSMADGPDLLSNDETHSFESLVWAEWCTDGMLASCTMGLPDFQFPGSA